MRVLSGSLAASTRFDVAAKVGGLLTEIVVDIGDAVNRGDVVARIDDEEFIQAGLQSEAELAVREAELARANADLERVTYDFERIEKLHRSNVASDVEFSEVSTRLAAQNAAVSLAEARVRQATAAREIAEIQKRHATVRATWSGPPDRATVGIRHEDTGDSVQVGDPIVTVVALDPLRAIVSVTENDYAQLRVGQTATLTTDARPGETFDATIARIAPIFEESSRQARIEFTVENPELKLRPGMFIRLRVVLREEPAGTIIPASAIVERSGRKVVFTAGSDGGVASEHWVKTGIEAGERVQLLSPNLAGHVVILGQHLLEDGAPVTIETTGDEGSL